MSEAKLTYGLYPSTKRLIHIEDAENGLACGCVCPECGDKLEAVNNGLKRAHHFRHSNGADCPNARMTALHMLAQQVLMEEKCVKLPAYKAQYYQHKAEKKYFDTVELETRFQTSNYLLRPDCIGHNEESSIWVEIFVTHLVNEEKRKVIKENDITCIEFDFSDLKDTDYTINDIKKRLLDENFCQWVNAPEYDKLNSQCKENFLRQQSERYQQEYKEREYIESLITTWETCLDNNASRTILDILNTPEPFPSHYRELILKRLTPYLSFLSMAPKDGDSVRILRVLLQNVQPTEYDTISVAKILKNNEKIGNKATKEQQITSLLALVIRIVGYNNGLTEITQFLQDTKIWTPTLKLAAIAANVYIKDSQSPIGYAHEIEDKYPDFAFACAWILKHLPQQNWTKEQVEYINKLENIPSVNNIDGLINCLIEPFLDSCPHIPSRNYKKELELAQQRDAYYNNDISEMVKELNRKFAEI